jgi:hypothetical protein
LQQKGPAGLAGGFLIIIKCSWYIARTLYSLAASP